MFIHKEHTTHRTNTYVHRAYTDTAPKRKKQNGTTTTNNSNAIQQQQVC